MTEKAHAASATDCVFICVLVMVLRVWAQGSWSRGFQRAYYVQRAHRLYAAVWHTEWSRSYRGEYGHPKLRIIVHADVVWLQHPWTCGFLSTWWLRFVTNRARFFPHYHTFTLHLEIKLGIRIKHRHPTELKILNLILLSLPLDRSTHLSLRSAYNHCKYKCTKITKSEYVKNCQCGIVNLNGE